MKRLHIHVGVADLEKSIVFYSGVFGVEPVRREADYAKWQLDDLKVNFAISFGDAGLSHLGIQVDADAELNVPMAKARMLVGEGVQETDIACCYARSNKLWIEDPAGLAWELFKTHASVSAEARPTDRVRTSKGGSVRKTGTACC